MLVTVGVLILLFVAYQLWGTGWFTTRAQHDLVQSFERRLAAESTTTTTRPPTPTGQRPPPTTASSPVVDHSKIPAIHEGDAIGIIHMPWASYAVIEGTSRNDLKKGPGHYPATVFPGELGNAAIAGHRTTYLAPFGNLDTLHVGSTFRIDTLWGKYTYRVTREPYAVAPSDIGVVATLDPTKATITLTACHPKYSARQRLVVQAALVVARSDPPRSPPPTTVPTSNSEQHASASLSAGLSGDRASRGPALAWGFATALVGALWWLLYRRWRHPITWVAGLLPFFPVLLAWYVYLERALPAGY